MQALVIGSKLNLVKQLKNFRVISIKDLSYFEAAKKLIDMDDPCLLYLNSQMRIEDPEEIWKFHKNSHFAILKAKFNNKEEICSFYPKLVFCDKTCKITYIGIPFFIQNKIITIEYPENKVFSIITSVADKDKYKRILLPSLHKANKFLLDNGLDLFETICVKGSDFKTIGEAYNHGISLSKSHIKIFIHEDLDLLEPNWVLKILLGFSDPEVGLLGLVGSTNPSYSDHWWMTGVRYIYGKQYVGLGAKTELWNWNWNDVPVSGKYGLRLVDGCFMATNRNIQFNDYSNTKFFLTPYEHELGKKILDMNLKIGVIKHVSRHWVYPKKDTSKIIGKEDLLDLLKEV